MGHHPREQDFCEDDAAEVRNAMLRIALTGDNDYDTKNAIDDDKGEPTESGQSKRRLKRDSKNIMKQN